MKNETNPVQRYIAHSIIFLLCMILCTGCVSRFYPKRRVVTQPTRPSYPGQPAQSGEQELLRQARQEHSRGNNEEALRKYEEFVELYPYSNQADSVLVSIGQLREILGQKSQAIAAYQDLRQNFPRSSFVYEASRRLAVLYIDEGMFDRASRLLTDLLGQSTRTEETSQLRILLGRAYLGQGNYSGALDLFHRVYQETSDQVDRDEANRGIRASIESMSPGDLEQTLTLYGKEYPGDYAAYVLAYRLYEAGRTDEARSQTQYFIENYPNHELITDAQSLLQAIDGLGPAPTLVTAGSFTPMAPPESPVPESPLIPEGPLSDYHSMNIACVLPLSGGAASKYGKEILKGLTLAFEAYQPRTPGFKSNLVSLDSKGDPNQAAEMVERVAGDGNILTVVGPLVSKAAFQAAGRAEERGLPMITITQKSGIPQIGPHIYRLFLTPEVQAQAVARYTVQILGLRRLAILYPNDSYGQTMKEYFESEVQRYGGQIVSVESYDPKGTDFSPQIQSLAGVGKALRKVGAGRKVHVDFEAVYLPDSYKSVAMIAPQFAYHDITTIRLLGTSLWHSPKLLSTTARYTQRSVIPTAFFAGGERPEVQKFVRAYRVSVGNEEAVPTQFEAYGYDAGMLLLTLMDQHHISTREDMNRALSTMGAFPGVTGRFSFGMDGEYQSEPILITVEGSEFKLIQ